MRTNIVIDDKLFKEAFRYAKGKTKKEVINEALQKFVHDYKRMDLRKLKGNIHFLEGYNYKDLRKGF